MHTQQSMEEMHTRVFAQLNNLLDESNRDVLQVLALVVILLLGVVDYWTGPEIAFSTFYLLPLYCLESRSTRRYRVLTIGRSNMGDGRYGRLW